MASIDSVPEVVRRVQPVTLDFPMVGYSREGVLFQTDETQKDFISDIWRRWHDLPDKRERIWNHTPPHIFRFDFSGIEQFDPARFVDGFDFVWGNLRGRKEAYSFLDQIVPWEALKEGTETPNRARLIIIARMKSIEEFELVGDLNKIISYQDIMDYMATTSKWVSAVEVGRDFPKTALGQMHRDGLLLKTTSGHNTFYRSIV